jgi:uncharacterized protein (DUF302 family)
MRVTHARRFERQLPMVCPARAVFLTFRVRFQKEIVKQRLLTTFSEPKRGSRVTRSAPIVRVERPGVQMQYYIAKTVSGGFPATVERVIESLKAEGFGILTEIDVKATMKKKLDIDFRNYRILGACNPPLAHQALTADDKIGTMLPCNVIVQDLGGGKIEVAAINPAISMEQVGNPTLKVIAESVTGKLRRVIAAI